MLELCNRCNPTIDTSDTKAVGRLADAMRQAGWDKHHERGEDGKRVYLWRRPPTT